MELASLSLTDLASIYNTAIENHELPINPVKKFASKTDAIKRIEKVVAIHGLEIKAVNDSLALVKAEDETVEYAINEGTNSAGEAAVPAKKAKKAKKEKVAGGKRGPAPQYADTMIITVLVANPKRPGSDAHARFAKYVNGMTVAEAVKAGLRRDDFRWDIKHNHIEIK